ncbi:MAG: CopG family transcriptional regulator [Chthoniobacteraceae bacterium]
MSKKSKISAIAPLTDEMIESGADLSAYLQNSRVVPAAFAPQKVNVDFPSWVVAELDREAERIGIARQALIKTWIVEKLESAAAIAR